MGAVYLSLLLLSLDSAILTFLAFKIIASINTSTPVVPKTKLAYETDMPSVTVCIPARNEEYALAECLQRVINSTYEKLEIIVLDDSSSDGTSLLIKSFAHAGVRFIRGSSLPKDWLGKNHALKELADQASGSYVIFMDVDTLVSPTAIENIVRNMLSRGVEMLSVLPRRKDKPSIDVYMSPLKYFWEMSKNSAAHPAVSGNAWIIKRSTAQNFFNTEAPNVLATKSENSIKNAFLPEAYIAERLGHNYSFVRSAKNLGVSSNKNWPSQLTTSTRLLFPMTGSSIFNSSITALTLVSLLVPHAILISAPWQILPIQLYIISATVAILFSLLYTIYAKSQWSHGWLAAFLLWPIVIVQEIILVVSSMILHKRKRILWKGRPIRLSN